MRVVGPAPADSETSEVYERCMSPDNKQIVDGATPSSATNSPSSVTNSSNEPTNADQSSRSSARRNHSPNFAPSRPHAPSHNAEAHTSRSCSPPGTNMGNDEPMRR